MKLPKSVKLSLYAITLFSSLNSFGLSPKINIGESQFEMTSLCFENGFIRLINNPFISKPVVERKRIDLENGEFFIENAFTSQQVNFYNRETKKYEIHEFAQCEKNLIHQFASTPIVKSYIPSAAEAVIYGNLVNHGINDVFQLDWRRYGSLRNYIRYFGEDDFLTMNKDFSDKSASVDWSNFSHWKDFSSTFRGGDRSGGGSDDITVRFRIDSSSLLRMSKEEKGLNKFLGTQSTYDRVIKVKKRLPKALMYIKDKSK